jgi:hypothetical protein
LSSSGKSVSSAFSPRAQRLHHLGQAVIGLRPHDEIDHRLAAHDLFALGLRDAARDADLEVGFASFRGLNRPSSE